MLSLWVLAFMILEDSMGALNDGGNMEEKEGKWYNYIIMETKG